MSALTPRQFRDVVWDHYRRHGRSFAWREEITPYRVFLSEVMLQQTQTSRIETKFPEFLSAFPTLDSLAVAPLADVLRAWQGLGYNRRGKYLWEAARALTQEYSGQIPRDPQRLRALPGIGAYTSCSIPCFAYNLPTVFIETNLRTVYLHHFFLGEEQVHDREILTLIARDIDGDSPRGWYYALMDYGAYLKSTGISLNHQSIHYRRQSRFAGSNRQVRATLLKHILDSPRTLAELTRLFPPSELRIQANLDALVGEGMVRRRADAYVAAG